MEDGDVTGANAAEERLGVDGEDVAVVPMFAPPEWAAVARRAVQAVVQPFREGEEGFVLWTG